MYCLTNKPERRPGGARPGGQAAIGGLQIRHYDHLTLNKLTIV